MRALTPTRRTGIAVIVAAGLIGAQAATASATTFRGQISDPVERPSDKSRDITSVASTFDNGDGSWNVSVTFAAAPTAATSARLYLGLTVPRAQCPLGAGGLGMQLETGSALGSYSQTCRQGTPQVVKRAISGNVLLLQVADPASIGLTPAELGQTRLSQHKVYDDVPATRMFADGAAATLHVGPTTRFRIARNGTIALPLTGVSQRARASMRLTTPGGSVLARRSLTAKPGLAQVRLQLSASARRHLSTKGTKATLTTKLTDSTGKARTVSQTITVLR